MEEIVLVIAGFAVVATAAYLIVRKMKSNKQEEQPILPVNDENIIPDVTVIEDKEEEPAEVRKRVIQVMEDRHKIAAEVIKNAVDNIKNESLAQNDHSEEFEDMLSELDNIMSEE